MSDEMQFVCPRCGGHYWGTSDNGEDPALGHCHDQYGTGCKFRWERSNDSEYFKPKDTQPISNLVEGVVSKLQLLILNYDGELGKDRISIEGTAEEILALVEPVIRAELLSTLRDEIPRILEGIDKDELDDGWWETSTGVEFGAGKLKELLNLLNKP